jgi:hypothetical protein
MFSAIELSYFTFFKTVLLFTETEMGYYQGNEDSPSERMEFVGKRAVSP